MYFVTAYTTNLTCFQLLPFSLPLLFHCWYHCHLNCHCHYEYLTGWWQTQTAAGALFKACLWLLPLNQRCDVNPCSTSMSSELAFSRWLRWVNIWLAAIFIMWFFISKEQLRNYPRDVRYFGTISLKRLRTFFLGGKLAGVRQGNQTDESEMLLKNSV